MMAIKAATQDVSEQLEVMFEDVNDMEHAIKCIQVRSPHERALYMYKYITIYITIYI